MLNYSLESQHSEFKSKTLAEKFKYMTPDYISFSQVDLAGNFCPFSLVLTIFKEQKDIEQIKPIMTKLNSSSEILTLDEFKKMKDILPTIEHELVHFLDYTSTFWGSTYLIYLKNAYIIANKIHDPIVRENATIGSLENEFLYMKEFYDFTKKIHLPKYYTELGKNKDKFDLSAEPHLSIGKLFNSKGNS